MAKIAWFSLPFSSGHINPTLGIVAELVRHGEKVVYFSTDQFKAKVVQTGAHFRRYDESVHELCALANETEINHFQLVARGLKACHTILPGLISQLQREGADLLVHEILCPWGKILAQKLGLPAISYATAFVVNAQTMPWSYKFKLMGHFITGLPHFMEMKNIAKRLHKDYQCSYANVFEVIDNTEPLNLVFTSRQFQPLAELFDDRFRFVGPSITPRKDTAGFPVNRLVGKRVIYISLGTVFNADRNFYRLCIDAFTDSDHLVVMSVGNKLDMSEFADAPANFIIRPHVPQLEILQHADLFITHGGMNSVSEAIYYQVPMLVIPYDADQPIVARRLQELGAGIYLKRNQVSVRHIQHSANAILTTPSFAENVQKLSATLVNAGGYKQAVREIMQFSAVNRIERQPRKTGKKN